MDQIKNIIEESVLVKNKILANEQMLNNIEKLTNATVEALKNGHRVYFCGNGGSAADAQHIAAEFVGRFCRERAARAAVALTTDTSILTAISNDYGFELIFARQIEALGRSEDVALAISTSGQSRNVIEGMVAAKRRGMVALSLEIGDAECDAANRPSLGKYRCRTQPIPGVTPHNHRGAAVIDAAAPPVVRRAGPGI